MHLPPITRAVFALLAGEALAFACPLPLWAAGALAAGTAWLACTAYGWSWRIPVWLYAFPLGFALAVRADAQRAAFFEQASRSVNGEAPVFIVCVRDVYASRPRAAGGIWHSFDAAVGPFAATVTVPVLPGGAEPQPGEVWRVSGYLRGERWGMNRFARRRLHISAPERAVCVAPVPSGSFTAWRVRIRNACSRRLGWGLAHFPREAGFIRAILLGEREGLSNGDRETFADAGTLHVFAISGLHVLVVAWAALGLPIAAGVGLRGRGIVALPVIAAYVVLTGARPSAVRALVMAACAFLAPLFGRRRDLFAAWSVTAFVTYAWAPARCFDVGCTFSFVVMFGIAAWLEACRASGMGREPEGVFTGAGVTVSAWAAGVPVAARVFGVFTPGGLLANPIVVRFAEYTVRAAVASLALSVVFPPGAALLNGVAAAAVAVMAGVSRFVAGLPWANLAWKECPWSVYPAWYGLCLLIGWGVLRACRAWNSRRSDSWMRRKGTARIIAPEEVR